MRPSATLAEASTLSSTVRPRCRRWCLALDNQAVDLVFLLLAPEAAGADHLQALARIARLMRDQTVAHKLRATLDAESLYAVLALPSASAA